MADVKVEVEWYGDVYPLQPWEVGWRTTLREFIRLPGRKLFAYKDDAVDYARELVKKAEKQGYSTKLVIENKPKESPPKLYRTR